jgi:hypothetical protein
VSKERAIQVMFAEIVNEVALRNTLGGVPSSSGWPAFAGHDTESCV